MPVGFAVLTPGTPPVTCDAPTLDLASENYPEGDWVPRVAVSIGTAAPDFDGPVLLVLTGGFAAHAPSLGFAQRAARRPVAGYVLVDPILPTAGSHDWPDAPVTVVLTPAADDDARSAGLAARLRGWEIIDGELEGALAEVVARP